MILLGMYVRIGTDSLSFYYVPLYVFFLSFVYNLHVKIIIKAIL